MTSWCARHLRPMLPMSLAMSGGAWALVCAIAVGCSPSNDSPANETDAVSNDANERLAVDTLPKGVERISFPQTFFVGSEDELEVEGLQRGWALFSPIPFPTSKRHRVKVVARVPEGATLDVKPIAAGSKAVAPTLVFPVGTYLTRVESLELKAGGTSIVDIRGVHFRESGEQFFVMRPASTGAGATLVGLSWARDDVEAEKAAHARMAEEMRTKNFGFLHRPANKDVGKRADHFVSIGRCSACHERGRPDFLPPEGKGDRKGFFPRRGTDDAGYYATASLFRLEQPRANYGKILGDTGPHFSERPSRECADDPTCAKTAPKLVALALDKAASTSDAHVRNVCSSRGGAHELASVAARAFLQRALPLCPQDRLPLRAPAR